MQATDPEVIYSRRKRLAISVLAGGRVVVRAPLGTSKVHIRAFLREQSGWIAQAQENMRRLPAPPPPYRFVEGEALLFQGRRYPLHLVEKHGSGLGFSPQAGFTLPASRQGEGARLLRHFYREHVRESVRDCLTRLEASSGMHAQGFKVTSARLRWGSCSTRNTLNFSYRLAMVPPAALEYVVAHELTHTHEHNHSPAFWALLGRILPGYERQREWLKRNGLNLPPL